MKNLLDHFRLKRTQEPAVPAPPPELPSAIEKAVLPAFTPSAAPRVVRPAWHAASAPSAQAKRLPNQPERSAPSEMLMLTLGDFLDRIPAEFLDSQEHDRSIPMPFDLGALSERMGRGETMILVKELSRRIPDIFRSDAVIPPERTMPFPWKRVLDLVVQTRAGSTVPGLTRSGVETLSLKLKARKFRRPSKMAPAPGRNAPAAGSETTQRSSPEAPWATAQTPALLPPPEITNGVAALAAPAAPAAPATPPAQDPPAQVAPENSASTSVAALAVVRLKTDFEHRLAALTGERDQAAAEIQALRQKLATHHQQSIAEHHADSELSAKFSLLQKEHAEIVRQSAALQADRDDAHARAAEFGLEHDAAIGRTGEIAAERDTALAEVAKLLTERDAAQARFAQRAADGDAGVALATELTAERDAAVARTTELTTERDAAVTRTAELTTERDAAVARTTELTAERDAAVARTTELTTERDAAVARIAELTTERDAAVARTAELTTGRDAAVARIAELTTERDAAVARTAELQTASAMPTADAATPDQDAWQSRAVAQLTTDIEGYRNTIQALFRERDALRLEHQQLTVRLAASGLVADDQAKHPTTASATPSDVYSSLFPEPQKNPRAAAVLVLALLALGVFSQFNSDSAPNAGAKTPARPAPAPAVERQAPARTATPFAEEKLTLEMSAGEETITMLVPEPLLNASTKLR